MLKRYNTVKKVSNSQDPAHFQKSDISIVFYITDYQNSEILKFLLSQDDYLKLHLFLKK